MYHEQMIYYLKDVFKNVFTLYANTHLGITIFKVEISKIEYLKNGT